MVSVTICVRMPDIDVLMMIAITWLSSFFVAESIIKSRTWET